MKWGKFVPIVLLALVLLVASACGGGEAAPTPTPTPTPTPITGVTPTPTPTEAPWADICPSPSPGKGNIAGHVLWNGQSWFPLFGKEAKVELYPPEAFGEGFVIGGSISKTHADEEGYFCFEDIEPGVEYYITVECPNRPGIVTYGPIDVRANHTFWLELDPYLTCKG